MKVDVEILNKSLLFCKLKIRSDDLYTTQIDAHDSDGTSYRWNSLMEWPMSLHNTYKKQRKPKKKKTYLSSLYYNTKVINGS